MLILSDRMRAQVAGCPLHARRLLQVRQMPNWMMFDVLSKFLALTLEDLLSKISGDVLRSSSKGWWRRTTATHLIGPADSWTARRPTQ